MDALEYVNIDIYPEDLPPGEWDVASFRGMIIFTSKRHTPRILYDGKLTRLNSIPFSTSRN